MRLWWTSPREEVGEKARYEIVVRYDPKYSISWPWRWFVMFDGRDVEHGYEGWRWVAMRAAKKKVRVHKKRQRKMARPNSEVRFRL